MISNIYSETLSPHFINQTHFAVYYYNSFNIN